MAYDVLIKFLVIFLNEKFQFKNYDKINNKIFLEAITFLMGQIYRKFFLSPLFLSRIHTGSIQ